MSNFDLLDLIGNQFWIVNQSFFAKEYWVNSARLGDMCVCAIIYIWNTKVIYLICIFIHYTKLELLEGWKLLPFTILSEYFPVYTTMQRIYTPLWKKDTLQEVLEKKEHTRSPWHCNNYSAFESSLTNCLSLHFCRDRNRPHCTFNWSKSSLMLFKWTLKITLCKYKFSIRRSTCIVNDRCRSWAQQSGLLAKWATQNSGTQFQWSCINSLVGRSASGKESKIEINGSKLVSVLIAFKRTFDLFGRWTWRCSARRAANAHFGR